MRGNSHEEDQIRVVGYCSDAGCGGVAFAAICGAGIGGGDHCRPGGKVVNE